MPTTFAANLLSIGAIDFGIVIDGAVVMIENIYRELALREGQQYDLKKVILAAAKDVDRPIFYSVAVILAGYLPIYALSEALRENCSTQWLRPCRLPWSGHSSSRSR